MFDSPAKPVILNMSRGETDMNRYEAEFGHKKGTISFEIEASSMAEARTIACDMLCEMVKFPLDWQLNGILLLRD